jgi:ubiquinone/menaquinone biosynthesis C-methylase UbiE
VSEDREYWANQWRNTKTTLVDRDVYYHMDSIKLEYARSLLAPSSRTLEVGAGSGRLSALLAKDGHRLTCLDYTPEALEAARRNFAATGVSGEFVQGDAFALPFGEGSFDAVFSTGLLEHYADPLPIVAEMARVLYPGGVFFSDIVPRKLSSLRALEFLRPEPPFFERSFTRHQILRLLNQAGLELVGTFAAGVFPPLWVPFLVHSTRYRHLHSRLVGATMPLLRRLDRTWLAEKLGFYWFCWGYKAEQALLSSNDLSDRNSTGQHNW